MRPHNGFPQSKILDLSPIFQPISNWRHCTSARPFSKGRHDEKAIIHCEMIKHEGLTQIYMKKRKKMRRTMRRSDCKRKAKETENKPEKVEGGRKRQKKERQEM